MITAMPRIAIAVHDFGAAVDTFRDAFGMPVVDFSETTVPDLGAHVGMCVPDGGSNIEIMSPSNPDMALSQSLTKFLDRRGEGMYALMLEAPDPNKEAITLSERGLGVLPLMEGAGGRDVHPRSTHGVLIRVYPDGSVPKQEGVHSIDPGLSGIMRVIVATTDASKAAQVYGQQFGMEVDDVEDDIARGVSRAVCRPPKGGVIELVSPAETSKPFAKDIELFLTSKGQGMYALVLQADDPPSAASLLGTRGLDFGDDNSGSVRVFGARFLIE